MGVRLMEGAFVTIQEIAERWGLGVTERQALLEKKAAPEFAQLGDATRQARLRATLQRRAAYDVVHEEVNRFKGPAPHQSRPPRRGVLGLTAKQFENASAKRAAFDVAEAAKPAKPAPAQGGNCRRVQEDQGWTRWSTGSWTCGSSGKRGA